MTASTIARPPVLEDDAALVARWLDDDGTAEFTADDARRLLALAVDDERIAAGWLLDLARDAFGPDWQPDADAKGGAR